MFDSEPFAGAEELNGFGKTKLSFTSTIGINTESDQISKPFRISETDQ